MIKKKTRSQKWLKSLLVEHPVLTQHLAKISSHKSCEIDLTFTNCHVIT